MHLNSSKTIRGLIKELGNEDKGEGVFRVFASLHIFKEAFNKKSELNQKIFQVFYNAAKIHFISRFLTQSEDILSDEILRRLKDHFVEALNELLDNFDVDDLIHEFVGGDAIKKENDLFTKKVNEEIKNRGGQK